MPELARRFLLQKWSAICLVAGSMMQSAWTQDLPPKPQAPTQALAKTNKPISKPLWTELSTAEQTALRPLQASWASLSVGQKRKWIELSKNYASLKPEQQNNLHTRMSEWAGMSSQQRATARLNFAEHRELTDGLTPEQRKAQWQAYQQLSPEQKRKLIADSNKPPLAGAAPAIKPQAALKKETAPEFGTGKVLAKAKSDPQAAQASSGGKIAVAPHLQQQGALLPDGATASASKP